MNSISVFRKRPFGLNLRFFSKRIFFSKIAFRAASSWLKVVPFGIRRLMNWIKSEYGEDLEVVITENGFSDYQVSPKSSSNAS